jgi:monoamine oxidase
MDGPAEKSSRREFLKKSGSVLTGIAAAPLNAAAGGDSRVSQIPEGNPVGTAVIGGGVAGLYTAWRLAECGQKVDLFEASDRLGGRLYTVPIEGTRIHAELGAMRFTSLHRLLYGLVVEQLKLSRAMFDFEGTWFYHLRGRGLLAQDLATGGPYYFCNSPNLEWWDKEPFYLVNYALMSTLDNMVFEGIPDDQVKDLNDRRQQTVHELKMAKNDQAKASKALRIMNKKDWALVKKHGQVENIPLRDTGFWNLLYHYLGNEGFLLVHDALGYESIVSNWNAAEAVPWFVADFGGDQPYQVIKGGFGVLVEELNNQISAKGGRIHKKKILVEVKRMKAADEYPWCLRFGDGGTEKAKRVILAIPRMPLEKIRVTGGDNELEGWGEIRESFISAVVPRRLFKVLLVFETAWWENLGPDWGGSSGRRVITDLPIRQVYYYSPKWIEDHNPPAAGNAPSWAMVMASYSDEHYVSFWSPFAPMLGREREGICQLPKEHSLTPEQKNKLEELAKKLGVPHRMVVKLRGQLADLHGVNIEKIPEPIFGIFMDWGSEPNVGGGWHTWEVNEEGNEVAARIEQPLKGEELYICGEAYSSEQGWVEGALQSTERVLKRLKLRPPPWFQDSDFDGYIDF